MDTELTLDEIYRSHERYIGHIFRHSIKLSTVPKDDYQLFFTLIFHERRRQTTMSWTALAESIRRGPATKKNIKKTKKAAYKLEEAGLISAKHFKSKLYFRIIGGS